MRSSQLVALLVVAGLTASVAADGDTTFKKQADMRSEPVKCVVALGESTTWGYSASLKEKCWVNQVVTMLEEFQGQKVQLINQGIGSNVLTPKCPQKGVGRPALLRVDDDVIAHEPDLVLLSYGLNDSRAGTESEVFRAEYQKLIDRIRDKIDPVIVILNVYYMHEEMYKYPGWDKSDYKLTDTYNGIIEEMSKANNLILADVYAAEVGVDWAIDMDHCHPNDLGHRLIANRVFEAIARNCSFVAAQMPKETLIGSFGKRYGNGPQIDGSVNRSN